MSYAVWCLLQRREWHLRGWWGGCGGGTDAEAAGCVGADAAGPSSSADDEEVEAKTREDVSAKESSSADLKYKVSNGAGHHPGPHRNECRNRRAYISLIPRPQHHEGACCSPRK